MTSFHDFVYDLAPLLIATWELIKSIFLFPFPKTQKSLNGEVALVTGSGNGIGAGIAKLLAQKGCKVICWDVNEAGNETTVQAIRSSGGEAYGFKVDVSNRHQVYEMAKKSEKVAGKVTILVNNAGIVGGNTFLESKDEMIEKTFEVNAISHCWMTKAFLPSMIENDHGHIVSIASSAGFFAAPRMTDYCASKAAAAHFADSLQTELYKSGSAVKVTWICPYAINTGMFDGFEASRPWLIDILTPEYVTEQVVYSIQTDADMVFLPKVLNVFYILNTIMPRKVSLPLMKWSGVLDCMNNFTGRTKPTSKKE